MHPCLYIAAAAVLSTTLIVAPANSQEQMAAPSDVSPDAVRAVDRMAAYLRTLQSFQVTASSTMEVALDDGQKLQFAGTIKYEVKRPNGFYADLRTDRLHREFFFDGSKLTMFAPRMQVYTNFKAQGTIRTMLDMAFEDYGVALPLADIFYWGEDENSTHSPTSAMVVGFARVNGIDADHYAFRENGIDYQLWIKRGAQPLPLKMVLTDAEDPDRPQYTAMLNWNLKPTIRSERFKFKPPQGATLVTAIETDSTGEK